MNISELARQLKTEPQTLREKLPYLGFDIGEKAIQVDNRLVEKIKQSWEFAEKQERLRQKLSTIKSSLSKTDSPSAQSTELSAPIKIPLSITVSDFARKIKFDVSKIIVKLAQKGVIAAMNQKIDYDTAHIVAGDFGIKTELAPEEIIANEERKNIKDVLAGEKSLEWRPPVVVVMGHVDHGKTTLLDCLRKTKVVDQESGGITQHIGAYQVKVIHPKTQNESFITFIDTPGHEAFRGMRMRGGRVADIAILVIAADDKIQPQTLESIEVIQKENLVMLVAINKIDRPEADVDRVKKQLSEIGLIPEDWGGNVICVPISAKKQQNIDELLENILLVAEVEELKANPKGELFGTIIESHIDKGLGPVATVIIQNGTLQKGDLIRCGPSAGRVKKIHDYQGREIISAGPSMPAQILGLKGTPLVGEILERAESVKDLKKTKNLMAKQHRLGFGDHSKTKTEITQKFKIVLKTDVSGSLEALVGIIKDLRYDSAGVEILKQGLGNFTDNDIIEAQTNGAMLIGFKVDATASAKQILRSGEVKFKTYHIIYELLEDLKKELLSLIPAKVTEEEIGEADVLAIFGKGAGFMIVGGRAKRGKITSRAKWRVFREDKILGEGWVLELQSNKEQSEEVYPPQEFGLKVKGDLIIRTGDVLRFYEVREEKVVV